MGGVIVGAIFFRKRVNHEGTLKDLSTHLHYQKCSFRLCLCMEFSEGRNCRQAEGDCGHLFDC